MRRTIELQADRIEDVLALHGAAGYVTGGTVTPRWVRFEVVPDKTTKVAAIKRLGSDLAAALDVGNVRIARRGATLAVEIPRDDPQPVRLLPLLEQLDGGIPPVTATLGIAEDGAPLLVRLPSPDVAHVLVAGTTGSGKTVLLRDVVLSLALGHRPHQLALVLMDPRGGQAFDCFATLPHLARPVVARSEDAAGALASLAGLMDRRDQAGERDPPVVVVIDELADLLMTAEGSPEHLTRLVQRGRGAGLHVVAATQKPTAAVLGPLVKANFPVRLVGKVTSSTDARVAAGWAGSGAERLEGRGDFVAIAEGRMMRFQAAYISTAEIEAVTEAEGWTTPVTCRTLPDTCRTTPDDAPAVALPEPEPEPDPVDHHVERLEALGWDPERSYRAACRALGEAEGGGPFRQVSEAVDRLRERATATATSAETPKPATPDTCRALPDNSGRIRSGWLDWIEGQEGAQ